MPRFRIKLLGGAQDLYPALGRCSNSHLKFTLRVQRRTTTNSCHSNEKSSLRPPASPFHSCCDAHNLRLFAPHRFTSLRAEPVPPDALDGRFQVCSACCKPTSPDGFSELEHSTLVSYVLRASPQPTLGTLRPPKMSAIGRGRGAIVFHFDDIGNFASCALARDTADDNRRARGGVHSRLA